MKQLNVLLFQLALFYKRGYVSEFGLSNLLQILLSEKGEHGQSTIEILLYFYLPPRGSLNSVVVPVINHDNVNSL